MIVITLLEKAADRIITKVRVRNLNPKSVKINAELSAMVNLLKNMDFEVDFTWSENPEENKIIAITLTLEGKVVDREA